MSSWIGLVAALSLIACGDDGETMLDGSTDGSRPPDVGSNIEPPIPPATPVLTPCPAGWEERIDDGVTVCAPFPGQDRPSACSRADSARFPGEAGCAVVGTDCPVGDFADGLPADRPIVYVLAGASAGDGSEATPYGAIATAIAAAPAGAVIAIGKGRYDEAVTVRDGTVLWGACVAETILTSSVRVTEVGVIVAGSGRTEVRNLRIADGQRPGITVARADAELHLESVIIENSDVAGIVLQRGSLTANELVVRDTDPLMPEGVYGRGLILQNGSTAIITRGALERNSEIGVFVSDSGSTIRLEDTTVWDTRSLPDGDGGRGISIQSGARAEIVRSAVIENRKAGIFLGGVGTQCDLEDVAIIGTAMPRAGGDGRGIDVEGGDLVGRRVYVADNLGFSLFASGERSTIRLEEAVVLRTGLGESASWGRGLEVIFGAVADIRRTHIAGSQDIGVLVSNEGSQLFMEDATVADGAGGRGLVAQEGVDVEIVRAVFRNTRDIAIYANRGSRLLLSDVVIDGVREELGDGTGGRAVSIQEGASLVWNRGEIRRVLEIGVFVHSEMTTAALSNITLEGVGARVCHTTGTCVGEAGMGIGAYEGGAVTVDSFRISDAHACGVQISDGSMDLSEGEIRDCPIGACIQNDGYDLDRLNASVRYLQNGINLQSTSLPIPAVSSGGTSPIPSP